MAPKKLNSKFKHMFCDTPKNEFCYGDIKKPMTSGEGTYATSSATMFAFAGSGGGGPVYYNTHGNVGRGKMDAKVTAASTVLDLQFNPFVNNLLGCVTEACKVAIINLPSEEQKESEVSFMSGHKKKAHLVEWHPTANGIIASTSWDKTVKLWNVSTESCELNLDLSDVAFSMKWNADGSLLCLTDKGQRAQIVDPRTADKPVQVVEKFCEGKKASKIFWADNQNILGFTCFSKQAKRMVQLRDIRKLGDAPLYNETFDQQSSILMPFYDEDSQVLFLAGKGDGTVSYKQLRNDGRYLWDLGNYVTNDPQKGGAWVPKRALDTTRCEIGRFMKLTEKMIIPCSFTVPRKTGAEIFQDDLYPEARSGLPSCTAEEYIGGASGDKLKPLTMSMDPDKRTDVKAVVIEKKATYAELAAENEALKKKIAELEAKLGTGAAEEE